MSRPVDVQKVTAAWLRSLLDAGIRDVPVVARHRDDIDQTAGESPAADPTAVTGVGESAAASQVADDLVAAQPDRVAEVPIAQPIAVLSPAAAPKPAGSPGDGYEPGLATEQRIQQLTLLEETVAACTRCAELVACRSRTVFGVGTPHPRLCFFGEAPGADEDRLGLPFVGRAGELLDRIIKACQMERDDVYILNTVKCRPPGNRNPEDDEIANCREYFQAQLDILQPEFICCLGAIAARTLLDTRDSIARLRGQFHPWRGSQVVVTYHPAYLLRTPAAKVKTWDDMRMLMKAMGVDLDSNQSGS